jgi:hypothetical protein
VNPALRAGSGRTRVAGGRGGRSGRKPTIRLLGLPWFSSWLAHHARQRDPVATGGLKGFDRSNTVISSTPKRAAASRPPGEDHSLARSEIEVGSTNSTTEREIATRPPSIRIGPRTITKMHRDPDPALGDRLSDVQRVVFRSRLM